METSERISIFIVDDESLARERLKRLISSIPGYEILGEAENGNEALKQIPRLKPDVVLLDIRMPGEDGLSVANKLTSMDFQPAIIFCSAYDEYAISAFKFNAIGYLLKPARKEELSQVLSNAQRLNQLQIKQVKYQLEGQDAESKTFVANTWQGKELIPLKQIYFFRSDQKYLTVVHEQGETLSDQTLKDLELLYPDWLIRVHRNTLVNKKMITGLHKKADGHYEVQLQNCPQPVSISRRHVSDLKEFLDHL